MRKLFLSLLISSLLVSSALAAGETPPTPQDIPASGQKEASDETAIDLAKLPLPEGETAPFAMPLDNHKRELSARWVASLTKVQRMKIQHLLDQVESSALEAMAQEFAQARLDGVTPALEGENVGRMQAEMANWQSAVDFGLAGILTAEQYQLYRESLLPAPQFDLPAAPASQNDCYYAYYYLYQYALTYAYYFYLYSYYTNAYTYEPYAPVLVDLAYNTYLYAYYGYYYSYYAYLYYFNATFSYYAYYFTRHAEGFADYGVKLANVLYSWVSGNTYAYYATIYADYAYDYITLADDYANACNTTGFNSQFNGSSAGWVTHSGSWTVDSTTLRTNGLLGSSASVSYNATFTNFDYRVRMYRAGCNSCANRLLVRGTPTPLASDKWWYKQYVFQYTRDGKYSVYKEINGVLTEMKGWTTSSAIKPGNAWNNLRVVANGSSLYFYINGSLVWSGTDTSLTSGRVGIGMFRSANSTGDLLRVDWATLTTGSAALQALPAPDSGTTEPVAPGNKDQTFETPAAETEPGGSGGSLFGFSLYLPAISMGNSAQPVPAEPPALGIAGDNQPGHEPPAGLSFDPIDPPVPEEMKDAGFAMSLNEDKALLASAWIRSLSLAQKAGLQELLRQSSSPELEAAMAVLGRAARSNEMLTADPRALESALAEVHRWQAGLSAGLAGLLTPEQYRLYQESLLPAPESWQMAPVSQNDCYLAYYYLYNYANAYAYAYYLYAYYTYGSSSDPYVYDNYLFAYYSYTYIYYAYTYNYYAYTNYTNSTYRYYAYYYSRHAEGFAYYGYQFAWLTDGWVTTTNSHYTYLYGSYTYTYVTYADNYAWDCYNLTTSTQKTLNLPTVQQEQTNWCWAGTAQAILSFHSVSETQCNMANYVFSLTTCCTNPTSTSCNQGTYNSQQSSLYSHFGFTNTAINTYLSFQQVQSEINANRPFKFGWSWTSGGGHAMAVRGYDSTNSYVYYMDPWTGEYKTITYSAAVSASDHTWSSTIYNIHQ